MKIKELMEILSALVAVGLLILIDLHAFIFNPEFTGAMILRSYFWWYVLAITIAIPWVVIQFQED